MQNTETAIYPAAPVICENQVVAFSERFIL
jgi:hypothetical protein